MIRGNGFTLMELLIVIIIVGILAVIASPKYLANFEKAKKLEALNILSGIRCAQQGYFATHRNTYSFTFPIRADFEGDGVDDIVMDLPSSPNFTYSLKQAGQTGYGVATPKAKGVTYYMYFDDGKVISNK